MSKYRTAIIACGIIGRVHTRGWLGLTGQPTAIGALADTNPDARREFGEFFAVPEQSRYADYREMLDKEHPDFVRQAAAERAAHGVGMGGDNCAVAFKGYALPLSLGQTSDGWIGEQAATWVRQQAGAPFFLMTSFPGPHAPHAVPSDYADLYDPAFIELPPEPPAGLADEGAYAQYEGLSRDELRVVIANYMACVTAVDACHGRVIQTLKDEGAYDETLIVM